MSKNFLKVLALIVVLAMTLSLVACGSSDEKNDSDSNTSTDGNTTSSPAPETVKLKIYTQYSSDDEKQPYDYAVEAMKKEMPNVELELEVEAQDDNAKIKTYAATGNLPDIYRSTTDVIEQFIKSNNILMLDDYASKFGVENQISDAYKYILKSSDGHIYAIPNVGPWAATLCYNKELFDKNSVKVPGNYEEFLAAVKAFSAKDITPLAIFSKEKWPGVQLYDMLVTRLDSQGVKKLDLGNGKISEDAYKKAAERLIELVKAGLISKSAFNTNYDQACSMFNEGKAAMIINGAWGIGMYAEKLGDKLGVLYSAPLADAADVEATRWAISGGGLNQGFSVNPKSANKDIAAEYVCKFALKFAEGRVVKRGDPNPLMKNPPQPEKGYLPQQTQYMSDVANFKSMTCFPWGLTNAKFKEAIENNTQKLLTGEYSAEDFIKDMEKALQ